MTLGEQKWRRSTLQGEMSVRNSCEGQREGAHRVLEAFEGWGQRAHRRIHLKNLKIRHSKVVEGTSGRLIPWIVQSCIFWEKLSEALRVRSRDGRGAIKITNRWEKLRNKFVGILFVWCQKSLEKLDLVRLWHPLNEKFLARWRIYLTWFLAETWDAWFRGTERLGYCLWTSLSLIARKQKRVLHII